MGWDVTGLNVDVDLRQKVREELIAILPTAMERSYGNQPMANGTLLPIVSPSELGDYDEDTHELVMKKYNHSGIFRLVSHCQTGTNVMGAQLDVMRVILHEATGDIRVCYKKIAKAIEGEDQITNMNDANALAKGWAAYIETFAYAGDLSAGLQGLYTIPSPDFVFSAPWSTLTAEQIIGQVQAAIGAHQDAFAESDLKMLALPTAAYNRLKTVYIAGSGQSAYSALLDANPGMEIVRIFQFSQADAGQPLGYLLPRDPDKLALVVDESVDLNAFNHMEELIIRGRVNVALVVAQDPTAAMRLRGI
jgi:hypothetical protein